MRVQNESIFLLKFAVELAQNLLQSGLIRLDIDARKIFIRNIQLNLRNKEFSLLICFIQNIGRVLSRTQLLEEVWDRNIFWSTNTVDVHVSHLRRKLKRHFNKDLIKTVYCIGYIFEI